DAVQQLGHLSVGLQERLGGEAQIELSQPLPQLGLAPYELRLAAGGRLREATRAGPQHAAEVLAERGAQLAREQARVELSLGRHDADLQHARAPALAHDEVAQPRAPVRPGARALKTLGLCAGPPSPPALPGDEALLTAPSQR